MSFWVFFVFIPSFFTFVGHAEPMVGSSSGFALSFTGIDPETKEFVSIASTNGFMQGEHFWPTTSITASFWFRSDGQMFGVFNIGTRRDGNYFQALGLSGTSWFQHSSMSIKQPNLSQWKHHAFTWDGINATWYLDGEVFLKGKFDVKPLDFSKDNQVYLTIGRHFNAIEPSIQSGPKFGSLGQLDDVALWNRVLLHEEIRDIFQGSVHLTGNELGLVLLYDFDDEDTVFSSIAKNKGQAGENYDLSLGTVLESPTFASTANTNHLLNFHAPCWVPSTRPSDLPRGKPVVLTVVPSEELEISLPALDSNGGAITVTITSLPQNGTLTSLNGLSINQDDIILPTDENYKVKYQVKEENKDIFAHDVFEYKAQDDDDGNTAFARVFVLRNTAPQALNISAFTIEDRTQSVHLLGSDCDGDQIRTWITRAPTRGKLYNADTLYESDVKQTE